MFAPERIPSVAVAVPAESVIVRFTTPDTLKYAASFRLSRARLNAEPSMNEAPDSVRELLNPLTTYGWAATGRTSHRHATNGHKRRSFCIRPPENRLGQVG